MKQYYALVIALLLVISCNNVKTDITLQQLTQKTENLIAINKAKLRNDIALLEQIAKINDSVNDTYELVSQVAERADTYLNYLERIKDHVKSFKPNTGKDKTINSLQKEFFSTDKITKQGRQFLDTLNTFKRRLTLSLDNKYPKTLTLLDSLFNTHPVRVLNNKKEPWLAFQFKSVSNKGALANLTLLQANVVAVESSLLSTVLRNKQEATNGYRVVVVLDKTKYYPGETVKGKLLISKSTDNLIPKRVVVNGNAISEDQFKSGEVSISFKAPKEPGLHPVKGELNINNGDNDIVLNFSKSFDVVTKSKVKVTKAKKINKNQPISVFKQTVKKDIPVNESKKVISNKDIGVLPKPVLNIRGQEADARGVIKVKKAILRFASLDVYFPNSDYEADVVEFSFKPSDQPTIKIYGNKLTTKAISIINKSKRGRKFKIFKVRVKLKIKPSYRVKAPDIVTIELLD